MRYRYAVVSRSTARACDAAIRSHERWFVSQAEEFRSIPTRPRDREGNLGQAWIGVAIPGKAIGKHCHPLHLPVPFAGEDGAGPEHRGPLAQPHGVLSSLVRRPRAVEQTRSLSLQVAQTISLQPVSQGPKQQMTSKVGRRWPSEYDLPMAAKLSDVEITQARDLDARHDAQAGRRLDSAEAVLPLSPLAIW